MIAEKVGVLRRLSPFIKPQHLHKFSVPLCPRPLHPRGCGERPVRLLFGPGQRHDATRSHQLIAGLKPEVVIADKGYHADHLHQATCDAGAEPVVPAPSKQPFG